MPKKVRPIPKGYHTVTPSLIQADSRQTIEFCKKAFGAKLLMKLEAPDGKIAHAEIQVGDSILMLNDPMGDVGPQPASLYLYVEDADKTFAKAVKAGGAVVMQPQDMFWGDRFGSVTDPAGNRWSIASRREEVAPREMKKRAAAMFKGAAAAG
ncbi:MAG TPA: VOC family protein [Candidatus Binatia bacterium]|nr:VOC family protein [Candidatus Binatia bacterium]